MKLYFEIGFDLFDELFLVSLLELSDSFRIFLLSSFDELNESNIVDLIEFVVLVLIGWESDELSQFEYLLIFELEDCNAAPVDLVDVFVSFKKFDHSSSAFFFSASLISFGSSESFFNFTSVSDELDSSLLSSFLALFLANFLLFNLFNKIFFGIKYFF